MTVTTSENIIVAQSSMQRSDKPSQIREDLTDLFERAKKHDWDAIGFTEAANDPVESLLQEFARKYGWLLFDPKRGGEVIAVNPKHKHVADGYVHVLDAQGGRSKGNFTSRGIVWVTVLTPAGNLVTFHEAHWITAFKLGPSGHGPREEKHDEQTEAMIREVLKNSLGDGISFWMGDTNVDEEKDLGKDKNAIHYQFTEAGLQSVYDALGEYPGTHGSRVKSSTIDIIGFNLRDLRVEPVQVVVLARRNADHNVVVAMFVIDPIEVLPPVEPPREDVLCGKKFRCVETGDHPEGKHTAPVS